MSPVERLLAIEAIRQLKARYFRFVDTQNWDGIAQLFTADAEFTRSGAVNVLDPWTGAYHPPLPDVPEVRKGRVGIVEMMRAAVGRVRTVHHGYMPEIDVVDATHAAGIWAMSDEIRDAQFRLIMRGRGHYHETYEKTGQGWQIKTARISRLQLLYAEG